MNVEGLLFDLWIAALPDNPYDPCPCGCGQKFKFIRKNPEAHEKAFCDNHREEILAQRIIL